MKEPIRILHLEDDPADRELTRANLDAAGLKYRITSVQTGAEYEQALRQGGYDVILADFRLPTYDGLSALRLAQDLCPDVPFIFVSGTMGEDAAIEGLTKGATDYVLKQKLSRLVPAIKRALTEAENKRERKRAEDELRLRESYLTAILENQPGLVWLKDKDGRFLTVNQAFADSCGKSSIEELINKTDLDCWPKELAEKYRADDAGIIKNKTSVMVEEPIFVRGETKWFETFKTPVIDKKGEVIGTTGYSRDITERRRAEEEIRILNQELEQRVADRTSQLEAANKELEAFSYSVSHDLRAPLRTIDGFSKALLEDCEDKLDSYGRNYLHRIIAATGNMALLIEDMLKLSRITRAEMDIVPVKLSNIAKSIKDELQRSEPERLVNFIIAENMEDSADPGLVRSILENLLGNAWKFTGKQVNAVIEFSSRREGENIVYFVRDNGAGFDMAYLDKLFAPFQRLHTTEEYPGTGIGLAIVKRIINRHGGKVWAEAQVGKGAAFYFTLQ